MLETPTMRHRPVPPLLPGSWLGLLGGGQLGRMFCMAAQTLGYKVCVLDPGMALAHARERAEQLLRRLQAVHLQLPLQRYGLLVEIYGPQQHRQRVGVVVLRRHLQTGDLAVERHKLRSVVARRLCGFIHAAALMAPPASHLADQPPRSHFHSPTTVILYANQFGLSAAQSEALHGTGR